MSKDGSSGPRLLVVGCGGIGGIVAAGLIFQGHDVTVLSRNELVADAINLAGLRTRGEQSLGTVPAVAHSKLGDGIAPFDYVLLCTQPTEVEEAARSVLGSLKAEGAMVVLQNGLCEQRVAEIAGADRVVGAIVAWGSTMSEPGLYDRTSGGGFTLGRLAGPADALVRGIGDLLEAIGPVTVTDDLLGARWSKLAINCAITSLGTVGGDRLGVLLRRRVIRRLALEIMTEAVEIARAEAVTLRKVAGTVDLDWLALSEAEKKDGAGSASLVAKHALLLAVGTRYRRLRSSMLSAIERGRPPAVDFLNGEVVRRGAEHGIGTPVNEAVQAMVWRIAKGELAPGPEAVDELWDLTRAALALPARETVVTKPEPEAEPEPGSDSGSAPESESEAESESGATSESEPRPEPGAQPR